MLGSIGTVGDAYDNATAESFVDTFKTALIKDRVWQTKGAARARDPRIRRLVPTTTGCTSRSMTGRL